MKKTPALLIAPLLFAATTLVAQEPTERFEERLEVTEVVIDALVTDRGGQAIAGLGADDFVVKTGDEEMPITNVTFFGSRTLIVDTPDTPTRGSQQAAGRHLIVFIHDQTLAAPELRPVLLQAARDVARSVDEGALLEDDYVAVLSYRTKLELHQDFTQDRERIVAAIRNAGTGRSPQRVAPRKLDAPAVEPSLAAHMAQGKTLRKQTGLIYDGLEVMAEASRHIPGRKNLLFISAGLGRLNPLGAWEPEARYYPRMMEALNAANVATYAVDLLKDPRNPFANGLAQLASDTNGDFFSSFANFGTPLTEMSKTNGGYYLISFRAEHPRGEVGFRDIEVTTRQPDLVVKSRTGYRYGQPPTRRAL